MKTVFIVRAWELHEGQYFAGVFSSEKLAREAINNIPEDMQTYRYTIDKTEVDDKLDIFYT